MCESNFLIAVRSGFLEIKICVSLCRLWSHEGIFTCTRPLLPSFWPGEIQVMRWHLIGTGWVVFVAGWEAYGRS